jgi:GT2 family glycosyltransferase
MPTRNRREAVVRAVRSVVPQLGPADELVVVDNASTDGTVEALAPLLDEIAPASRLLVEPRGGTSQARNSAIAAATNDIVCFLDDDATVTAGWLEGLRAAWASAGPRVATIGGPIVPMWSPSRPAWLADHLLYVVSALDLGAERRQLHEPLVWGANMSLLVPAVEEVGGFDLARGPRPGIPFGRGEEIDLERRLLAAGYEIWWEPSVPVEHHLTQRRLRPEHFHAFMRDQATLHAAAGEVRLAHAAYRLARVLARRTLARVRGDAGEAESAAITTTYWRTALAGCIRRPEHPLVPRGRTAP